MVKQSSTVNICFCQGVVKGQIFSPTPSVAKLNVMVRCDRKNPKTKKKEMHVHNFTAYGADALQMTALCHDGSVVFLTYHIEIKLRVDRQSGVSKVVEENVVDSILVHPDEAAGRVPYLNRCFFQGIYLGVAKQPNAEGIFVLSAYAEADNGSRLHVSFIVYGEQAEKIQSRFSKGQRILIEYKIEKSKRILRNGKNEYFTNRVVERVG